MIIYLSQIGEEEAVVQRQFLVILTLLFFTACPCLLAQEADYEKENHSSGGVSVRNNIFYDISGTPNLGIEIPVGKHISLGGNVGFKPWPRFFFWDGDSDWGRDNGQDAGSDADNSKWKHFLVAPEIRWWPGTIYENGWFFGADLVYSHFNVGDVRFPLVLYPSVRDHRKQGDLFALGVFAGHSWWLSNHWRLEGEVGVGAGPADYSTYSCEHCGTHLSDDKDLAVIPKLALNLAYNFAPREIPPEPEEPLRPAEPVAPEAVAEPVLPALLLSAVPERRGIVDSLIEDNPIIRPVSEYQPYTTKRVLRKEKGAKKVYFELDKSVLKESFVEGSFRRDNRPALDSIMDITRLIMSDSVSRVATIQIIGLASFEGREAHNKDLASRRAFALQHYVQQRVSAPDSLFDTVGGGEAWTEFRDELNDIRLSGGMTGLSAEDISSVIGIIDSEQNPDRREARIKATGPVWQAIKENILKNQRNSGYVRIFVDWKPDREGAEINSLTSRLVEEEKPDASTVSSLAEESQKDSRALNAYGVALWRAGRQDEAVEVLRRAAASEDETASENLEAIASYRKALASYRDYLSAEKEYGGKKEEYDKAMEGYMQEMNAYREQMRKYNRKYRKAINNNQ